MTAAADEGGMTRTVNIFVIVAIALWSLFSLGVWALFSLGGDLIHSQLDWIFFGDPDVVPVVSSIFRFFQSVGLGLVIFIWAVGSAALWLCGSVLRRLLQGISAMAPRGEAVWFEAGYDDPLGRPMKDVTPQRPLRALPRD